jgi:hypothetical protein
MSAIQVWTMLPEYEAVTPPSNRPSPNPANLDATHIRQKDVEANDNNQTNMIATLRAVYETFQEDESWPGATGDVLVDHTGQAWMVIPTGFITVHGRPGTSALRQRTLRVVD